MKKTLILFTLIISAFWILNYLIQTDSGYILIQFQNTRIKTDFWIGALSLLCLIFFLYLLIKSVRFFYCIHNHINNWFEKNKEIKTKSIYQKFITHLIYEDFQQNHEFYESFDQLTKIKKKDQDANIYLFTVLLGIKIFIDRSIQLEKQEAILKRLTSFKQPNKLQELACFLQALILIKQDKPYQAIKMLEQLPEKLGLFKDNLLLEQYYKIKNWKAVIIFWQQKKNLYNEEKLKIFYLRALIENEEIEKAIKEHHEIIKEKHFSNIFMETYQMMIQKLSSKQLHAELIFFNKESKKQPHKDLLNLASAYLYEKLGLWQQAKIFYEIFLQSPSKSPSENSHVYNQAEQGYHKLLHTIAFKSGS